MLVLLMCTGEQVPFSERESRLCGYDTVDFDFQFIKPLLNKMRVSLQVGGICDRILVRGRDGRIIGECVNYRRW
jgi:hypothetical protein